jgi:hypothetical protein
MASQDAYDGEVRAGEQLFVAFKRLRDERDDLKREVTLLWTALTNQLSAEGIDALSAAVLAARVAGKATSHG